MAAKKAPKKPKFTPRPYKPRKPKPKPRRTDDEILADARKELKRITDGPKFIHRPYKPRKPKPKAKRSHSEIRSDARKELKRINSRPKFSHRPYKPKKKSVGGVLKSGSKFDSKLTAKVIERPRHRHNSLALMLDNPLFNFSEINQGAFVYYRIRERDSSRRITPGGLDWCASAEDILSQEKNLVDVREKLEVRCENAVFYSEETAAYHSFLRGPIIELLFEPVFVKALLLKLKNLLNRWLLQEVPDLHKAARRHESNTPYSHNQRIVNAEKLIVAMCPSWSPISAELWENFMSHPNPSILEIARRLAILRHQIENLRYQILSATEGPQARDEIRAIYRAVDYNVKWSTQLILCRLGMIVKPLAV
jgi:hypothetical protein